MRNAFEVIAEMNKQDAANNTTMVSVCTDIVSINQVKSGTKVTIGVPPGIIKASEYVFGDPSNKVFLCIVNAAEFDKRILADDENKIKKELQSLITDEQLDNAWGNANFGKVSKRDLVANTLLKCASGYSTGHTAKCICQQLGLITTKYTLTVKGKEYLWVSHYQGKSL